ncbi:hypothetical protein [Kiritimatiella glycovorans]|uniref:PEP-CTERM protein-sorting domain-containing protein n=1 Tax=Kiritimatiella glycovorans TaxID=1307763 RepID=A0A0G3EE74_9BACT|nr:hypothetical protein [Kiritimatiella glycovorans]AKJ64618.1 hypothetical protein L21SP4_01370 [Kiritimatiella glycovorans]
MKKLFVFAALVTVAGIAGATDYTWDSGTGDWSDTTMWSPSGSVPDDNGDTAELGSGELDLTMDGDYTIGYLTTVGASVMSLNGPNTLTIDPNTGTAADVIHVGNAKLTVGAPISIINSGAGADLTIDTIAPSTTAYLTLNDITVGDIGGDILFSAEQEGTINLEGTIDATANDAEVKIESSSVLNFRGTIQAHADNVVRVQNHDGVLNFDGSVTSGLGVRFVGTGHSLGNTGGPALDGVALRLVNGAGVQLNADNQFTSHLRFDNSGSSLVDFNGHDNAAGVLNLSSADMDLTFDFSDAAGESVSFSDSSGFSWTGSSLELTGFEFGTDSLRFGTSSDGLTSSQLELITIDGVSGDYSLDNSGYLIPEPATITMLGTTGLALGFIRRRFVF